MVFVTYDNSQKKLEIKDSSATLLHAFIDGGYYFMPLSQSASLADQFSRYLGLYIPFQTHTGWNLCKTIHSLVPQQSPIHVQKDKRHWRLSYDDGFIEYDFTDYKVLHVHSSGTLKLPLVLDCREMYDFSTTGRHYAITREGEHIFICYSKKAYDEVTSHTTNFRDSSHPYECVIAIKTTADIVQVEKWICASYALEKKRNAGETTSYLYHPFTLSLSGESSFTLAAGYSKTECLKAITASKPYSNRLSVSEQKQTSAELALTQAKHSFKSLFVHPTYGDFEHGSGLYAGLPWFFQFWSRDESISLIGLLSLGKYDECKKILFRELETMNEFGQITNRFPHSELPSADGTGWMAKRFIDLLIHQPTVFTKSELLYLYDKVKFSITSQEKYILKNGFIKSEGLETWMDTGRGYDERQGSRIEIQVLHVVLLRLRKMLAGLLDDIEYLTYESAELTFAQNVRAAFYRDGYLCDGIFSDGSRDHTIRPNVFLAHYLYPKLLTNLEWESVFDKSLKALWQNWGGLSTIDKLNHLFKPYHTGQTNESYHRGDSWYWINNLAAISLRNVNADKYASYISSIIAASSEEILQHGSLGCHAEISDSASLSSLGCYNQLWSCALFIELVGKK